MPPVAIAILAYESLCVAEEAKHHRVVDGDAGQRERHALKEPRDLRDREEGGPLDPEQTLKTHSTELELDVGLCQQHTE